jgi:hypothetical protein
VIGLMTGAAELAEIEAGAPFLVLAPGAETPHCAPLLPLVLSDGVLARPGIPPVGLLPLPRWARPLALVAPPAEAERLRAMLPAGVPVAADSAALLAVLAQALHDSDIARLRAESERDRLTRMASGLPPLAQRVIDLPPSATTVAPPVTQPLGRSADGICSIGLHLASAGGSALVVRLLGDERLLGRWRLPAARLAPGWLRLDLPEPAPIGSAEAMLEIALGGEEGTPTLLSAASGGGAASLALRADVASPGWSVLPLHFDWAAYSTERPALPLPLPESALAAVQADGGGVTLVAAGDEAPRLLLEVPPGGKATIRLPPVPVGPTDLLRARLVRQGALDGEAHAELVVSSPHGAVNGGSRRLGAELEVALPLPPGPMVEIAIAVHHLGARAAVIEIAALALVAGASGEPCLLPPPASARPTRRSVMLGWGSARCRDADACRSAAQSDLPRGPAAPAPRERRPDLPSS